MSKSEFLETVSVLRPGLKELCYGYSEETEKLINEIHFCDTYNKKEWDALYEKCKDNIYAIYAISTTNTIPAEIINKIVYNDTLYSHTNSSFETDLYYKIFLNLLSQKDITEAQIKHICNYHSVGFYEQFNTLTYDGWDNKINECDNFPIPENYCKIPSNIALMIHNIYMSSTLVSKFKFDWRHMPLRFINNNVVAIDELEKVENNFYSNKEAEQVCAAIANNANLAYEIREKAMSNTNLDDIYFASDTMKKDIYLILADSYYSSEINLVKNKNKELTPEEKTSFTQARKTLIEKIQNGFFSNAELTDIIYRAKNIHGGKYIDKVLETLFKSSNNSSVLKLAYELDKRPCVEVAFMNPYMEDELKEKYIDDITMKIPYGIKKERFNFSDTRHNAIKHIVNSVELEQKSKYKPAYRNFLQIYMPEECAKSPFTPTEIIEEIVSEQETRFNKLYKNLERNNNIDALNRKCYLHGQLNLLMRNANFQKDEIKNFFSGFEYLCVYNKIDWFYNEKGGHHFTPQTHKTTNYIQIDELLKISKTLFNLPDKKKQLFTKLLDNEINKYNKKQPQFILLTEAKKVIDKCNSIAKAYYYRDFSECNYKTIEALSSIFAKEYGNKVMDGRNKTPNGNGTIIFYEELEFAYKASQDCQNALNELRNKDKEIDNIEK